MNERRRIEIALPLRMIETEGLKLSQFTATDVGRTAIGLCRASILECMEDGLINAKRNQVINRLYRSAGQIVIRKDTDDEEFPVRRFNVALAFLHRTIDRNGYPFGVKSARILAAKQFFSAMIDNRAQLSEEDGKIETLADDVYEQARKLGYYCG